MIKSVLCFLIMILFLVNVSTIANDNLIASNSVDLELFAGSGIAGASVNYSRIFYSNNNLSLFGRIGFGTLIEASSSSGSINALTPLSVGMLYGSDHNLELSVGRTFISDASFNQAEFGYRNHPNDGGFLFRAGGTMIFLDSDESILGGYIGFGIAF
ncbi:hypothetical protein ASZ90_004650 [hydrocarbon metagenome]|uniref:Outer membrane protein beta-barrel domain-containing protein n=1 Tax=hydrocarbon metagenome TaxID=938273 RepID=A0A0W8FX82_9ZZZZ